MTNLSDRNLEKQAIKLICKGATVSNKLLASLTPEHFHNKYTREAFKRVSTFAKQRSEIISWTDLLHDPALSDSAKEALALYKKPVKINEKTYKGVHRNLENFRKQRFLYEHFRDGADALTKDTIDHDKMADMMADAAAKLRSSSSSIVSMNIGEKDNSISVVKKLLLSKGMPVIPTGFMTFDKINRGFFRGSAVTLGGYTGAGKTALADQLSANMSERGFKVCQVSLEMNEEELMTRKLARISKTSLTKLINPAELTREEKKKIYRAHVKYSRALAKKGGQQNVRVPDGDVSIEEILFTLKPYGYDVIIVDYITLLKGTDGDDQWRKLGAILRFCKVFARSNDCVVIMLVQVNQDGSLRYSKAMAEHSNNAWIFVRDDNFEETKLIHVDQLKARMGKQFKFDLYSELDLMTITDVPDGYEKKLEKKEEKSKIKKKEIKEDEWLKQF